MRNEASGKKKMRMHTNREKEKKKKDGEESKKYERVQVNCKTKNPLVNVK